MTDKEEILKIIVTECGKISSECSKINDRINQTNNKINEKYHQIVQLLTKAESTANKAIEQATENKTNIEKNTQEIEKLKQILHVKDNVIQVLQNDLAEQTDRQMRSTLIIRGIPLEQNEKSWDDTAEALANYLYEKMGWDRNMIKNDIDRIHRGSKDENRSGPPPIFAKFVSWRASQKLLTAIIKANKQRRINATVHPMFSKHTQANYDTANRIKRELKKDESKKDWITFVKYPGILMVKKSRDDKYEEYEGND